MTAQPKGPKKTHPPRDRREEFGVFVAGKGFANGEGGYLNREQYDAAVKELTRMKKYQDSHGMPQ
jgi:hypothetical protein